MTEPARSEAAPVASIEDRAERKRKGGWWETTWYPGLSERVPGVDSKTLVVARHLAKRAANKDDGHCWPSLTDVVKSTRLSPASVRRAIRALELAGEVWVDRGGPRDGSSHYWLSDPELDESGRRQVVERAREQTEGRKALFARQMAAKSRTDDRSRRGRGRRLPAIAAGQLELPVATPESGYQVLSNGRRVTPPPWCQRTPPPGVTQIPRGVRQTPGSLKGSSGGERNYRARRSAEVKRRLGESRSA